VSLLTIAEHFIVSTLPRTGIQNAKLEVDGSFLFLEKQQILEDKMAVSKGVKIKASKFSFRQYACWWILGIWKDMVPLTTGLHGVTTCDLHPHTS
jgi:hypothetical protein